MKHTTAANNYPFLTVGGEMGTLTHNYDWSTTTLGTPDQWPSSLRTLVTMMLTSRFPMLIFWGPELITFYNDAFRPSLGDDGKHPTSLGQRGEESWAESWPVIGPMIYAIMAGGEAVWFEDQKLPIYRDGRMGYAYWTYSFSPLTDDNGAVSGILVTCSETTKVVESIRQLAESEQRFQNLIRGATVGIIVLTGEEMQVSIVNDAYGRLIDRTHDELIGKKLFEVIPDAESYFRPLIDGVRSSGEPLYLYDTPYAVRVNGTQKAGYLNIIYQPYRETDGTITGVMVLCQDVTQQVLAQAQTQESEARFRSLIEEAPVATCLFVGRELRIEVANDIMLGYWGKPSSVLGLPLAEAVPILKEQPFLALLDKVFTTGNAYSENAAPVVLEIDGVLNTHYFNFTCKPLRDATGAVYAIMDMAMDVTSQVAAQQQLQQAEESLRSAIEVAEMGTWELDIRTGLTTYSERLKRLFEFSEDVIEMGVIYDPIYEPDRPRVQEAMARAANPENGGLLDEEYRVISQRTKQQHIVRVQARMYFDAIGQAQKMIGTMRDITDQRQLQMALEQQVKQRTEELASVNEGLVATNKAYAAINTELEEANALLNRSNDNLQQFAYVASHDLQEPLRKIQSFGDMLKSQYATQLGDGVDHLQRMQTAASRMSTLIRDLLTYSRISTQRETTTPVSLTAVVNTALTDLDLLLEETGAIVTVDSLPTVLGDSSQLGQLFQNLFSNSLKFRQVDALPRIRVGYESVAASDLPFSIKPTRQVAAYYRVDVADNGIGFDDKYIDRIFQVFQRLNGKTQYAGTGIGLAICEKVVANHGGAITAQSQPGQGALFSVYLPQQNV